MSAALIGHSGFVGGTLLGQRAFDDRYRSTDIERLAGREHELIVCAGAPGQKWLANRDPERDRGSLERLMAALSRCQAQRFVLISTVDVFARPTGVDESSSVDASQAEPYGAHRLMLERFVAERFARHAIVRLPALVGSGLRKNAVHDLHHRHQLEKLDPRAVLQYYPVVHLWRDIERVLALDLRLVHLVAEPIALDEIARTCFGITLAARDGVDAIRYDVRTRHAAAFGGDGAYAYDRAASLRAIQHYARTEARRGAPVEAP